MSYRPARVSRLLGQQIDVDEAIEALAKVEIATDDGVDGALTAIVPRHRRDIEIEEDVIEEIARVRGYETIPPRRPDTLMPPYRADPRRFEDTVRDILAGRGLTEVVTHGLIAPVDHERLGFAADDQGTIRVANPVTADHQELRRSLLPGMLAVLARNERQRWPNVAIFEVGPTHLWARRGAGGDGGARLADVGRGASPVVDGTCTPSRGRGRQGTPRGAACRGSISARIEYRRIEAQAGVEHPGRTAEIVAR